MLLMIILGTQKLPIYKRSPRKFFEEVRKKIIWSDKLLFQYLYVILV